MEVSQLLEAITVLDTILAHKYLSEDEAKIVRGKLMELVEKICTKACE